LQFRKLITFWSVGKQRLCSSHAIFSTVEACSPSKGKNLSQFTQRVAPQLGSSADKNSLWFLICSSLLHRVHVLWHGKSRSIFTYVAGLVYYSLLTIMVLVPTTLLLITWLCICNAREI